MNCETAIIEKLDRLKSRIKPYRSVLVAYSGGVDSTLLLSVSAQVLGSEVTAVTVRHMAHSDEEMLAARQLTQALGVRHHILDASAACRPLFNQNDAERCYLCKRLIFEMLLAEAGRYDIEAVLDGSHTEDLTEERPGMRALAELGIAMPLREAGLNKRDIRLISKYLSLPTYNKPARPCLATRFPPGEAIDDSKLQMVQKAETYLAGLGIEDCRVRYRDGEARIETTRAGLSILLDMGILTGLDETLSAIGFSGVLLDLKGRRGQ